MYQLFQNIQKYWQLLHLNLKFPYLWSLLAPYLYHGTETLPDGIHGLSLVPHFGTRPGVVQLLSRVHLPQKIDPVSIRGFGLKFVTPIVQRKGADETPIGDHAVTAS